MRRLLCGLLISLAFPAHAEAAIPTAEVISSQWGLSQEIAGLEAEFERLQSEDAPVEQENMLLTRVKEVAARAERTEDKERLSGLSARIEETLTRDIARVDAEKRSELSSFPGENVLRRVVEFFHARAASSS